MNSISRILRCQKEQQVRSRGGPLGNFSKPCALSKARIEGFSSTHNDNGLGGRGDVVANNIGGFGRKVRVIALAPGLTNHKVYLMVAQEPPDILHVNIAQRSASRGPVQRANPCGAGLSSSFSIPVVCGLRIDRLLAGPRLVLQASRP